MGLSRKQLRSIREATASVNVWHGSIRSGKTIASLLAFLAWLPTAPAGPIAIIGRTRETILRNILDVIRQIHPDAIQPWTKGATTTHIMGREVHLIGVNDARSEEKVRGLTLAGAYVDEITLLQRAFFVQLLGRLSVHGSRLFGTTNPDSPQHWFKVDYLDRAEALGWRAWHFTMADNPGLTEEYKTAKAAEFTGLFYQRFILGLWVAAEGAIYDAWDPARHVIPWGDLPRITRFIGVGIDYGTTNPTVAILLGLGADGCWYAVDEWAHVPATAGRKSTDAELSAGLRAWLTTTHTPEPGSPTLGKVYIDPAAASFREQLKRDGLSTVPAANDVLPGIRRVSSLLAAGKLRVSDRCTTLISEAPGYVWDTKATDKGEDKPVKLNDHACFIAGTMVETEHGARPIETLRAGDRAWTRHGLHVIKDAGMTSDRADVMTVTFSNGETLTGTGNHPIWVPTRGWVPLDALRYGDTLEAWSTTALRPSSTRASSSADTPIHPTSRTVTTTRRGSQTRRAASGDFIKRSGWTPTAPRKSPRATMSTTSTMTRATTTRATSRSSTVPTTSTTTAGSHAPMPNSPTGASIRRGRLSGTGRQQVARGTASTVSAHGRVASLSRRRASSAGSGTNRLSRSGSARTPASRRGVGTLAWTTSTAYAPAVASRSESTGTQNRSTAPVHALHVTRESEPRPVYNITVSNAPEYYAGGVLVHNCDALRYVVAATARYTIT